MQLPKYVLSTLSKLNNNGFCAYLVGGCVRDNIMGRTANDYDITTNALPQQILDVFKDEKTLDIGIQHGTVTVVYGKECVEVTTYRIDGTYKDNRHPDKVEFTDNIELDLKRRDFTVNAIAYSPKCGFVDPFNGTRHIQDKVIVCVGNPDERFNEDSLRIMRGLRFSSVLDFDIEQNTARSIIDNAVLLNNVSAERINSEFSKLICGIRADTVLYEFRSVIFAVIPQLRSVDGELYKQTAVAVNRADNRLSVRLAVFFSMLQNDNDVVDVLKQLKFDNKTVNCVGKAIKYIKEQMSFDRVFVRKTVFNLGFDDTKALFQSLAALHWNEKEKYEALIKLADSVNDDNDCVSLSGLAIDGKFLREKYGFEGRQIGEMLQMLLYGVMENRFENSVTALVEILDNRSECDEQ